MIVDFTRVKQYKYLSKGKLFSIDGRLIQNEMQFRYPFWIVLLSNLMLVTVIFLKTTFFYLKVFTH